MLMKSVASIRFIVPFADVDMMGHVNNVCYLRYFENARTEHLYSLFGDWKKSNLGLILAHAEIDYKSPANYRDEIRVDVRVARVGNSSWVYEYLVANDKQNQTIATGKTVQVTYDYERKKPIPIPVHLKEKLLKELDASQI
jgi:acyl-CoA thioester hydrolase